MHVHPCLAFPLAGLFAVLTVATSHVTLAGDREPGDTRTEPEPEPDIPASNSKLSFVYVTSASGGD